jgi:hypothetical protein
MALIIVGDDLLPDKPSVRLPATIEFSVSLRDTAARDGVKEHTLVLRLEEENDLFFETDSPGDPSVKEIEFVRQIAKKAKKFTFTATVAGEGTGLGAFNVTLDVPGTSGTGCLVRLK